MNIADNMPSRVVQIDVLRGFAVLGIYWINIFVFALPASSDYLVYELDDAMPLNAGLGFFNEVFIEGTMRALFSMLFGAAALIFLAEQRLATSGLDLVDRYYRRTLLLLLFGLIHAYLLLWPYDVLYIYGLFGLFLFPLRKLSVKTLVICALLLLFVGDINLSKLNPGIDSNVKGAGALALEETDEGWIRPGVMDGEQAEVNIPPVIVPENEEMYFYHSGYIKIFQYQLELVVNNQSLDVYQDEVFDIGGMMLMGMALYKLGVFSGSISRYVYLVLLLLGYILGPVVRLLFLEPGIQTVSGTPWFSGYNLGRLLLTLGHIGLVGLLCQSVHLKFLMQLLANVGRMALTNYIMQTVISIFLFFGFGFSLFGLLQRHELAVVGFVVCLFQIIFSSLWLARYRQGPLEWVWRSLIYKELQVFRKNPGNH